MVEMTYSQAVGRLIEFVKVASSRDQRIWDAHVAHVSKAEIARLTGLSWQTVDRVVRDMAAKQDGTDAGETKTAEAVESGPQTAKQDSGGEG